MAKDRSRREHREPVEASAPRGMSPATRLAAATVASLLISAAGAAAIWHIHRTMPPTVTITQAQAAKSKATVPVTGAVSGAPTTTPSAAAEPARAPEPARASQPTHTAPMVAVAAPASKVIAAPTTHGASAATTPIAQVTQSKSTRPPEGTQAKAAEAPTAKTSKTTEPSATKVPKTTEPSSTKASKTTDPSATKSKTAEPSATKSKTAEPSATKSKTAEASATKSKTSEAPPTKTPKAAEAPAAKTANTPAPGADRLADRQLAECGASGSLGRSICNERVRLRFCRDRWNKHPDCRFEQAANSQPG